MTSSYSVYLYFNGYVYAPEEATAKAGACLFWCIESEPPWEREALGKTGLMFSKSISEWNVYRTVETRGTLYQEGSFLREAWREQVIIRIHRKRFPVKAEQNFTFLRDPQLWSACTSFFLLFAMSWCYWCCCLSGHMVVWVIHVPTLNCLFSSNQNPWESPHWLNFIHMSPPFSTEGNVKIYHVSVEIFEISYIALVYVDYAHILYMMTNRYLLVK